MIWLVPALLFILFCFAIVVFVGAPYLPTLSPQVKAAMKLADLQEGQTLLELGCGDGKVILAAAQKGYRVIGYELNPILAVVAYIRTWRYRQQVQIIWGDFWNKPWPKAEAIFVFLIPKYMDKLNNKIDKYNHKPVKLVSFAFEIPNRKPDKQKAGVLLYKFQ